QKIRDNSNLLKNSYFRNFHIINVLKFQVNLRLILVSGKTKEFVFALRTSASEITQYIFDNWPREWDEEKVESSSLLKLIYHGRFLHGSVTLNALSLPSGKTTVMHLVTRENLPEPNSNGLLFAIRFSAYQENLRVMSMI
ncbi:unnamed protein product, partial [Dracunculus medinensis]|uniref:Rad60-SLD_2 domain-containing protein n=1 Tax=Dracunculus medinensis TaxID=318479 RepID=A0A0N4UPX2_DRAME